MARCRVATPVIAGIAAGCKEAGAALVDGETAEMPDLYAAGDYDLAGFCVGAVEAGTVIDGPAVRAGNSLIGVAASGPHANGYSLIQRLIEHRQADLAQPLDGRTLAETLLLPTRIYVRPILDLIGQIPAMRAPRATRATRRASRSASSSKPESAGGRKSAGCAK
jgi:phosphoribosylformylglycinamidine cyclo-ligase